MDKQKEIEKMEKDIGDCVGLTYEGERFTYTLHTQKYLAKELIERGYGDTKAAAKEAVANITEDIFSWLYDNLVNANFATGNAEISMWALQNKAAEYGIDFINNEGRRIEEEADND